MRFSLKCRVDEDEELTEVESGTAEGSDHDTAEDLYVLLVQLLKLFWWWMTIITHNGLGVALRLILESLLGHAARSGGEEAARDDGSHCD